MKISRHFTLCSVWLVCFCAAILLAPPVWAADATNKQAEELAQLQARVNALEKEVQAQKTILEMQATKLQITASNLDSRMYDFANITSMLGSQSTWVGNLVAMTGIGITLLVFGAGIATYFSAKERAKKEARSAAKKWFGEKAQHLETEIEQLLAKAKAAQHSIESHTDMVLSEAQDVTRVMQAAKAEAQAFMHLPLTKDEPGLPQHHADTGSSDFVAQANENLKSKPEKDFTADEHYIRGASLFHSGNWQAALDSFDAAHAAAQHSSSIDQVKYRMARAFTLATLERVDEAISAYDEINQLFGTDPQDSVREQVAIGLLNKGISLGEQGRLAEAVEAYNELDARFAQDNASAVREQVMMGLSNKAFKLGKLERFEEAVATYAEVESRFGTEACQHLREHRQDALKDLAKSLIRQLPQQAANVSAWRNLLSRSIASLEKALQLCVPQEKALIRSDQQQRAEISALLGLCLYLADEKQAAKEHIKLGLQLGGEELGEHLRSASAEIMNEAQLTQFAGLVNEALAS